VALDTEFVWERTYYPKLGIVQLGLGQEDNHLIDTVALDDLSALGPLLESPEVVKILHDAQQDLIILRRATGAFAQNIFDTRRAAGFVGLSSTLSLGDLVQETTGVYLPKTQSRTDWLRRPLSDKQRDYALDDVRYMHAVRADILARAERMNHTAWLQEEMTLYDAPALYEDKDPHTQFERLGGGRLSGPRRAVLREVAAWREQEARQQDRPRGHVVNDKVLKNIARRPPRSQSHLSSVRGLDNRDAQRYGKALWEAVQRGLNTPEEEQPDPPQRRPQDDALLAQINLALAYLTGKGLADGIDPALVASRSDVTALLLDGADARSEDHALLQGWRGTFMGQDLLDLMAGRLTIRVDPESGLPRATEK
ncbi:MAG TPA: HRDC domain-containing protein, partial [Rhodothermales bacterium]|nr:HRDC domain-containing protein [Rhodothermales bacterium]